MSLTVAVQMDPIQNVNIAGDSTFALMLEAQKRGHDLLHYHHRTLALRDGKLTARGEPVRCVMWRGIIVRWAKVSLLS
jgi:glutathione synthase